jgi:N6-adenosine-specific RNA methylase IME4
MARSERKKRGNAEEDQARPSTLSHTDDQLSSLRQSMERYRVPVVRVRIKNGDYVDGIERAAIAADTKAQVVEHTIDTNDPPSVVRFRLNWAGLREHSAGQRAMLVVDDDQAMTSVSTLTRAQQDRELAGYAALKSERSVGYIRYARSIAEYGDRALIEAVKDGSIAISDAYDRVRDAKLLKDPSVRSAVIAGTVESEEAARIDHLDDAHRAAAIRDIGNGTKPIVAYQRAKRAQVLGCLPSTAADGSQRHNVVIVDFPWWYRPGIVPPKKDVRTQYPLMSRAEIIEFDIERFAAKDCVFFLWATMSTIWFAHELLLKYGCEEETIRVWAWDKNPNGSDKGAGMGYADSVDTEFVVIGRRGDMPLPLDRFSTMIRRKKTTNSTKPSDVHERAEAMYPRMPRIELFARSERDGWTSWGPELPGTDSESDKDDPGEAA